MKTLSVRYRLFSDRLLAGDNYVDAYLAAGFKCKRENVGKSAWRLRQNPMVIEYLEKNSLEIDALKALQQVVSSATPNPVDHPSMFKAWGNAYTVIGRAKERGLL